MYLSPRFRLLGFNGSALAWTLETQFKQGKKAQTLAGYSPGILDQTTIGTGHAPVHPDQCRNSMSASRALSYW